MTLPEYHLRRQLVIAVALKLAALMVLWWCFVRDARVDVDADRAAAHLASPAGQPALRRGVLK
jgi:hypothetical protein